MGLLLVGTLLVAGSPARGSEMPERFDHVIPPGQDELLAQMLGRGASLPDGCQFVGGQAQGGVVTAEYTCGPGRVVLELRHPADAPSAARRSEQFAIVVRSGSAPDRLLDAVVSLVRAHETAVHWKSLAAPPSTFDRGTRVVGVAAALSGAIVVGLVLRFLLRRGLPPAGAGVRSVVTSVICAVVSAGLLCVLTRAALRAGGSTASGLLWERPVGEWLGSLAQLVTVLPAAMVAAMVAAWATPTRRLRVWGTATIVGYVAVGYWMSLLPDDLHYFGTLSTLPPNFTAPATGPSPGAVYRTNDFGFREPSFDRAKPPRVLRVALLGDSYVYGTGISEDGTLRARLAEELDRRWPDQRFEVLNLGIPGDNLSSHVGLFAAAVAQLDPDAVVLCLTLPNDLSRWDEQVERHDARRVSLFSFARFLIGDAASWLWAAARLETSVTSPGLAHLDEQLTRLEGIRQTVARPPVLFFFGFHEWNPEVLARLGRIPNAAVVADGVLSPEHFIPGDGHPTAFGNSRSAARIGDTLAADSAWRALIARAPER